MAVDILPEMRVARQSDRVVLTPSAVYSATFNSAKQAVGQYNEIVAVLDVTVDNGTTLDVKFQVSADNGITWTDLGVAFTQAAAATVEAKFLTNFGDCIRTVNTIVGTSWTFSVKFVGKS